MRGAGRRRERRGDDDQRKVAHLPIELGEAQVVANRQTDAPARQVDAHHAGAGLDRAAFVVTLLAAGEREEVDLVVAGDSLAVGTVDQAGAAHATGVARRDRHGAADQPDPVPGGESREECLLRPFAVFLANGELVGRARAEDAEVLGQHDEARAFARCLRDQRLRLSEVGGDIAAGNELHRGDAHPERGARHRVTPIDGCPGRYGGALAVAAALRLTIGSDQLPDTVYS